MNRVVVIGSVNVDIIARVDRLPVAGQTLLGDDAAFRPGGKGANQAVAASRLGADTTLIAAVGTDAFGRQVRAALDDEGVHLDHLLDVDGSATGIAMIVVAADGENTIVVSPGANATLDAAAARTIAATVTAGDIAVIQLEIPMQTARAAAVTAHKAGATVVLNAAPLPGLGDPDFHALLHSVDVLIVNETEALALADQAAPADTLGWIELADDLRRHGPRACVITLGSRGAVAHDGDAGLAQSPYRANPVDTTGAGDAFCGALASALAAGSPLADAVRQGCAAGALATGKLGAQSALPTRAALDALLGEEA